MHLRTPLFPGTSEAHQVQIILSVQGYSIGRDLGFYLSPQSRRFCDKRVGERESTLHKVLAHNIVDKTFVDLVGLLLLTNPSFRLTAE